VYLQAEDRAHRLGQQGCVQVRYLIAPGTVDDAMWPLLGRKLQVVGKALDGHATATATGKSLPVDESLRTAVHDKHKLGQSKCHSMYFQLWDKVQSFRVKPHFDALSSASEHAVLSVYRLLTPC